MTIIVCGMPGSGGETIARALRAAGLASPDDGRFTALNDEVLAVLGGAWDAPPPAAAAPGSSSRGVLARARRLLSVGTVLEDPLAALLLPWWQGVADGLRVVLAVAHPATVAKSGTCAGLSEARALKLWAEYNSRALAATSIDDRFVVHLDRLDPGQAATTRATSSLLAFAGLRPVSPEAAAKALDVLSSGSANTQPVHESVAELYGSLLAEAGHRRVRRSGGLLRTGVRFTNGTSRIVRDTSIAPTVDPSAAADRLAALERRIAELAESDEALRAEVGMLGDRVIRLLEDIQGTLEPLRPKTGELERGDYTGVVQRLREAVRDVAPIDATVAVISRGDPELLRLYGRTGWHFPRQMDGRWLGYHPKNSLAAIAQIETQRALGAEYLVIPATSSWWFTSYEGFAAHVASHYEDVYADPNVGRIIRLERRAIAQSGDGRVGDLLARLGADDGSVVVLDLTADSSMAARFPIAETFAPVQPGSTLPYASASIPVVAVDGTDHALMAESRRVATYAVVDPVRDAVEVLQKTERPLPSVSIVMPVHNNAALTLAALRSLAETLPAAFSGQLLLVDDGSGDETRLLLETWRDRDSRITLLRNQSARGYLQANLRGITAATGDYLLFVNNDMVFLDGWLEPLLRTFEQFPDAGVVGARLLYPDGRLQEAGGLLFADGSAAKYGYGDPDPEAAAYAFIRATDYCSGCLLLTPRTVFDKVGGFDRAFDPGYYEDTDYCLRVRRSGLQIYYQPDSVVVHVEGGTAGLDETVGMKRHQVINRRVFMEKWHTVLAEMQPSRPDPYTDAALHALVLREGPRAAVPV